jgi:hypothetical protein
VIIDQRDVQRMGGRLAKYPSAYVVSILLRMAGASRVLDVTYGLGRFYYVYRPRLLVGADPVKRRWIVAPDKFYQTHVWGLAGMLEEHGFDVVVCDPPKWRRGVHYNKRGEYNLAIGDAYSIVMGGLRLARERAGAKYFLLHYDKVLPGLEVVEDVEFIWWARYLYTEKKRPSHFTLYKL